MSEQHESIDEQLSALDAQLTEYNQRRYIRTANRIATEIKRKARAEGRLIPYLHALFRIMVDGSSLLTPGPARDAAIEAISLLESPDRARLFQPDLPEAEYEHTVQWMSACAYDNLAKNTAAILGSNSDGMHQCISDGIQVCRRTGKMQCVTCFREYATEVYAASDDLDMAFHFSRLGLAGTTSTTSDRRYVSATKLMGLQLLTGDLSGARETAVALIELTETYHTPKDSRLHTQLLLQELSLLSGDSTDLSLQGEDIPPPGEDPWLDLYRDRNQSASDALAGNFEVAIERLSSWDRTLRTQQCTSEFFTNRLRLLCVLKMAGKRREIEMLGEELEEIARPARDWLTLRVLDRIRDERLPPTPRPTVAPLSKPASAKSTSTAIAAADAEAEPEAAPQGTNVAEPQAEAEGPPTELLRNCWKNIVSVSTAEDPQNAAALAEESQQVLLQQRQAAEAEEAAWMLHTMRYVLHPGTDVHTVWSWARQIAGGFPQDAACLSLLANLGVYLKIAFDVGDELIDFAELERLFKLSLDLDPSRWRNFERAGNFFQFRNDLGEAERCFARAFRLARREASVAVPLASIYNQTDRPHDALAVLDLCLREGVEDPEVTWQAVLTAFQLGRFDVVLTYIDRFEQQVQNHPWGGLYRIAALLELGRYQEANDRLNQQQMEYPDLAAVTAIQRASACGGLGDTPAMREALQELLSRSLRGVDYVPLPWLAQQFSRLWTEVERQLGPEQPVAPEQQSPPEQASGGDLLLRDLRRLLLQTGLAPNPLFEPVRRSQPKRNDLGYYECLVHQPLDDAWPEFPGCLHGQEEWTAYECMWGVLAADEEQARKFVLQLQSECYPLAATVSELNLRDSGYEDHPGVVWQGYRGPAVAPAPIISQDE